MTTAAVRTRVSIVQEASQASRRPAPPFPLPPVADPEPERFVSGTAPSRRALEILAVWTLVGLLIAAQIGRAHV